MSVKCPETTWWILAKPYSSAMYIIVSIHFKLRYIFMQVEKTHSIKIINISESFLFSKYLYKYYD